MMEVRKKTFLTYPLKNPSFALKKSVP